jgi:hypothetical protein
MSKRKSRGLCFLDIKDLLKFDSSLHYFSVCPACKELVSDHKDVDFQRDQLAQISAEEDDEGTLASMGLDEGNDGSTQPKKKKQKVPYSAVEAASLVQQGKLCCTIGCMRRPLYNFKGLKARFCRQHKEESMVNSKEKCCEFEGCENPATHSHRGKKGRKMCIHHKEEGMTTISVCGLICVKEGCMKSASFNYKGQTARYCFTHKEKDMINVYREKKLCVHEGCDYTASFNFPGKKVARYCSVHKDKDMINLKSTVCAKEGCPVQPYYNWRGEKRGLYCSKHKDEGMVNLQILRANRVCSRSGCEKVACFAFSKNDNERYCAAHKDRGMIDVQNTSCENEDCEKRPNFNFVGYKKGRFCATHKEDGMINVVNERRKERENMSVPVETYEY